MSLTHCPGCHQLSFVDAESCHTCGQAFQPGQLQKVSDAEDRAFKRKAGILFFTLLIISLGIVLAVILRGYMNSAWVTNS
jgi:hypothetical protein